MKDLHYQAVLLWGPVRNGLYVLPTVLESSPLIPITPMTYIGERTSSDVWHSRLGHPSSRTATFTINKFQLPITSCAAPLFCSAYAQEKSHFFPYPPPSSRSTNPFELLFFDV